MYLFYPIIIPFAVVPKAICRENKEEIVNGVD
jgi:hypothetical protein